MTELGGNPYRHESESRIAYQVIEDVMDMLRAHGYVPDKVEIENIYHRIEGCIYYMTASQVQGLVAGLYIYQSYGGDVSTLMERIDALDGDAERISKAIHEDLRRASGEVPLSSEIAELIRDRDYIMSGDLCLS